ncbi:MAG: hypothetical protein WD295_06680, partial [Bacteroidota bacterium]
SYIRAKSVEPSLGNEANQLIAQLNTLTPMKEDYFFNRARIKEGRMEIQGSCYSWIGETVSVPAL